MDDLQEIMEDFLIEAFEMNEQLDQDLVKFDAEKFTEEISKILDKNA